MYSVWNTHGLMTQGTLEHCRNYCDKYPKTKLSIHNPDGTMYWTNH